MSLRRRQAGRGVLDMRTGRATLHMVISSPLTVTEYLVCEENAGDEKLHLLGRNVLRHTGICQQLRFNAPRFQVAISIQLN